MRLRVGSKGPVTSRQLAASAAFHCSDETAFRAGRNRSE